MAARRQIIGDLAARRIAQARERDVRGVFAAFRLEPEPLQEPLLLGLQLHQRRYRRGGGPYVVEADYPLVERELKRA